MKYSVYELSHYRCQYLFIIRYQCSNNANCQWFIAVGKKFDRAIKMPLRIYSAIENTDNKKLELKNWSKSQLNVFFRCVRSVHSSAILLHEQRSMFHISYFSCYLLTEKYQNDGFTRSSRVHVPFPIVDQTHVWRCTAVTVACYPQNTMNVFTLPIHIEKS